MWVCVSFLFSLFDSSPVVFFFSGSCESGWWVNCVHVFRLCRYEKKHCEPIVYQSWLN